MISFLKSSHTAHTVNTRTKVIKASIKRPEISLFVNKLNSWTIKHYLIWFDLIWPCTGDNLSLTNVIPKLPCISSGVTVYWICTIKEKHIKHYSCYVTNKEQLINSDFHSKTKSTSTKRNLCVMLLIMEFKSHRTIHACCFSAQ